MRFAFESIRTERFRLKGRAADYRIASEEGPRVRQKNEEEKREGG